MAALGGIWLLPYLGWTHAWLFVPMLLASPFLLLAAIAIRGSEVKIIRLIGPFPYWIHRIPRQAKFDFYEAWEDPAPTGVGFGVDPSDPIHLGTAASADALYQHVSEVLERGGWRQTAFGWEKC